MPYFNCYMVLRIIGEHVCDYSSDFDAVSLFNREIIRMITRVTTKIPNIPFPIMGREFKKASMFKFI